MAFYKGKFGISMFLFSVSLDCNNVAKANGESRESLMTACVIHTYT